MLGGKKYESCRSFHLSTISCCTWQTLDTTACRQRPGNPRSCLASLPSPIPEELQASGFLRGPCVEVSFVSLASGIPSHAWWLGETGASVS